MTTASSIVPKREFTKVTENLLRFSTTCTSPPGPIVDDTADADEILDAETGVEIDATEDTSGYTSGSGTGIVIGAVVSLDVDDLTEDLDLDSGGGY